MTHSIVWYTDLILTLRYLLQFIFYLIDASSLLGDMKIPPLRLSSPGYCFHLDDCWLSPFSLLIATSSPLQSSIYWSLDSLSRVPWLFTLNGINVLVLSEIYSLSYTATFDIVAAVSIHIHPHQSTVGIHHLPLHSNDNTSSGSAAVSVSGVVIPQSIWLTNTSRLLMRSKRFVCLAVLLVVQQQMVSVVMMPRGSSLWRGPHLG